MERQSPFENTSVLEKNKVGRINVSNVKTYYTATVITTVVLIWVSGTEQGSPGKGHTNRPNWFLTKVQSNCMEER